MDITQGPGRLDEFEKVRGATVFLADLDFEGRLVARCLRSPHAHARILHLDATAAREVAGVRAVITAAEIPGRNVIPLIQSDWPALGAGYVRHVGEAVALVAAEDEDALEEGLKAIAVDYEPLPAILEMEKALEAGEVMAQLRLRRGESAVALEQSDVVVVEGTYHTSHQDHAYLEPQGVLALPDGTGGVLVMGSLESPFAVQRSVATVLGWSLNRVRVVQLPTGGAFGGKEETPALLGAQAALLSVATRRPVRLALSREEDMEVSSKRHPARIRCRTGATRDGHLVAAEVDCLLDGGAYATLSALVLQRAANHACGSYRIPNLQVNARVVRTHKVPCGTFRGSGEAQVLLAAEGQMDLLAERLGMDPLELRRRNALAPGDATASGEQIAGPVGLKEVLERAATASDWARKRALFGQEEGPIRHGIGMAASYVKLETRDQGGRAAGGLASASVAVHPDGSVSVSVGRGDSGQGLSKTLGQIAAQGLGCPKEVVRVLPADTSRVYDVNSLASPTPLLTEAVRDAALRVRASMDSITADAGLGWREGVETCVRRNVPLAALGFASPVRDPPEEGKGQPTFSVNVAEVEVDSETGETRVLKVNAVHSVGRILDLAAAEGQVVGGIVQGLGFTLLEGHTLDQGSLVNRDLSTYLIPTTLDAPDVSVVLMESEESDEPRGVGEVSVLSIAPAILAAIHNAVGVRLSSLPATPERIREVFRSRSST